MTVETLLFMWRRADAARAERGRLEAALEAADWIYRPWISAMLDVLVLLEEQA